MVTATTARGAGQNGSRTRRCGYSLLDGPLSAALQHVHGRFPNHSACRCRHPWNPYRLQMPSTCHLHVGPPCRICVSLGRFDGSRRPRNRQRRLWQGPNARLPNIVKQTLNLRSTVNEGLLPKLIPKQRAAEPIMEWLHTTDREGRTRRNGIQKGKNLTPNSPPPRSPNPDPSPVFGPPMMNCRVWGGMLVYPLLTCVGRSWNFFFCDHPENIAEA